ncbi:MAG: carbohydrate ABC transporter permease [Christensenellales bacterium]|jgi:putative aldouronate transport system permease protein
MAEKVKQLASRSTRIHLSTEDRIFTVLNYIFWGLVLLIILYPLYLIVISSVSDPYAVMNGEVLFFPVDFSLVGYERIMKYNTLWRSYYWAVIYTVSGTVLGISLTMLMAYALSNKFPGKTIVNFIIIFTMFFSGGLIPTFLVMKDIGLYNKPIIMVLMGAMSVWNTMIARTYISTSIPGELYEAAMIDGSDHFQYFFKIVLPLSGTIVAVLSVYYAVAKWNDFFTALVYLRDSKYWPLQTVLRQILAALTVSAGDVAEMFEGDYTDVAETLRVSNVVKYCAIIISTIPAVALYLLMQDYFVKGVMIGSIKG